MQPINETNPIGIPFGYVTINGQRHSVYMEPGFYRTFQINAITPFDPTSAAIGPDYDSSASTAANFVRLRNRIRRLRVWADEVQESMKRAGLFG